jgi:hypothetical protein
MFYEKHSPSYIFATDAERGLDEQWPELLLFLYGRIWPRFLSR